MPRLLNGKDIHRRGSVSKAKQSKRKPKSQIASDALARLSELLTPDEWNPSNRFHELQANFPFVFGHGRALHAENLLEIGGIGLLISRRTGIVSLRRPATHCTPVTCPTGTGFRSHHPRLHGHVHQTCHLPIAPPTFAGRVGRGGSDGTSRARVRDPWPRTRPGAPQRRAAHRGRRHVDPLSG